MYIRSIVTLPWFRWFTLLACLLAFPHCTPPQRPPQDGRQAPPDGGVTADPSPEDNTERDAAPTDQGGPTPPDLLPGEPSPEPVADAGSPDTAPDASPDGSQGSRVGAPCTSDGQCGGSPARCVKESELPRFPFPANSGKGPPGGYCVIPCTVGGAACPADAACVVPGAAAGVCMKRCASPDDCRPGYTCGQAAGSDKVCLPPECSLKEPKGPYNLILTSGRAVSGSGPCQPVKSGTSLLATLELKAGKLQWELASKPGSPLPVTWRLTGPWTPNQRATFTANNNDGSLEGRFTNACLLYGTLQVRLGKCTFAYEITVHKR